MHRAMIVEDDRQLLTALRELLVKHQLTVFTASSVALAGCYLDKQNFDVMIVDRVLSDGDGLALVKRVHQEAFETRVLILSQKSEAADRLTGLRHGADDYLAKPFTTAEFWLRVNHLLHRRKLRQLDQFTYKDVQLLPSQGVVWLGERKINLRAKETAILACLLQYQRQIVTRDRIIDLVWSVDEDPPQYQTIDVYMRRIRSALGEHGRYLKTVRGFGFMFD